MAATNSDNLITQAEAQQPPEETKKESLGRQSSSSIYSLTLDEFQTTLSESGKNFGSMNMDEFLNSIWTAEDNHETPNRTSSAPNLNTKTTLLTRQASLTVPEPLCRKTVDQVWSEIHKTSHNRNPSSAANSQRQITSGEMFLVKAGVVRAQNSAAACLSGGGSDLSIGDGYGSGGFGQIQD